MNSIRVSVILPLSSIAVDAWENDSRDNNDEDDSEEDSIVSCILIYLYILPVENIKIGSVL